MRYVVAARRASLRPVMEAAIAALPGEWTLVSNRAELTTALAEAPAPRYVFFIHWSWLVTPDIVRRFECVGFHMTDLPFGRGGSPLQNLIVRGIRETQLSAFRLDGGMDTGPIYMKTSLSLDGRAEGIYERTARLALDMMAAIVSGEPQPVPQTGEPVLFERRTPAQSRVPPGLSPDRLYDFIRMLDADGYPHAFVEADGYRVVLTDAVLDDTGVAARARVTRWTEGTDA